MAVFVLLPGATRARVVAARNGRLVDRPSQPADGISRRSAAGKPVRMDVAGGRGDQVNEGLMSSIGLLVGFDQFLQPVPAAPSAVKVDDLDGDDRSRRAWPARRPRASTARSAGPS